MYWKRQSYAAQPLKALALELKSLFAEQVSLFNHAREENRAYDHTLQTLQRESNRGLATALRDEGDSFGTAE